MGPDKGSLTEQQTKRTVTTTILIRRIYRTNSRNAQSSSHAPEPGLTFPRPASPFRAEHDGTW